MGRGEPGPEPSGPFDVDARAAYPARIFNYLLGGDDNFEADREAAHHLYDALPGGIEAGRTLARAARAFVVRTVAYLAADAGIRQFVTLGNVVRDENDVHDVALRIAPDARVVYVILDSVVLAHAHELQARSPAGSTAIVQSDLRDLRAMMREAGATLDLTRPVAVILPGILHYVSDKADPRRFLTRIVDMMAPGSYVVVSHAASDIGDGRMAEVAKRQQELARPVRWPMVARSREEVTRLLDGLDLVDPGVVTIDQWRPSLPQGAAASASGASAEPLPSYGAVARKPA